MPLAITAGFAEGFFVLYKTGFVAEGTYLPAEAGWRAGMNVFLYLRPDIPGFFILPGFNLFLVFIIEICFSFDVYISSILSPLCIMNSIRSWLYLPMTSLSFTRNKIA